MTSLRSASASDVGMVRTNNQDVAFVGDVLWAVADGMGGHAGGEVASRTAIDALVKVFSLDQSLQGLEEAVREANQAVWDRGSSDPELRGMGTTVTAAALVRRDGRESLALVNVGDSRAYLFQDGRLSQLTEDHSLVQEMVRSGELSPEEATIHPRRHILTRVLGMDPEVDVDTVVVSPTVGDRLVLCSDGLVNEVGDPEIADTMSLLTEPGEAAGRLVQLARDHGGNDNITVVVIDVVDDDAASSAVPLSTDMEISAGALPLGGSPDSAPDLASGTMGTPAAATIVAPEPRERTLGAAPPPRTGPAKPRTRRVTLRVVAFLLLLLVVLAGVVTAVGWFATRSYYVGIDGNQLAIYQGRPGGFLWFQPHVSVFTGVTTSEVLPSRLDDLRNGMEEPSVAAAHQYISNLQQEARSLQAGSGATASSPATSSPTTSPPPSNAP
ncbi:MAG: Stp1/IreP family PP2C-type Ser/Thr phosphatase [Acidimicrobiales bacterium]